MKKIPMLLIWFRLVAGFVAIMLACTHFQYQRTAIVVLLIVGLLSDIFDGIIARRLGVSTEKMRRLDSSIDQVFWLCIVASSYLLSASFYIEHWLSIVILLLVEGACYLVSYIRFRKEVATHAISSKIWVLLLTATLIQLILTGDADTLFTWCFYVGIITRVEIIAILLLIKQWTNDVPSVYAAVLLRNGKQIKRNKIFNG